MVFTLEIEREMEALVAHHWAVAETGFYTGQIRTPSDKLYFEVCKGGHPRTGTILIFTRDIGYHTSGWFKNPDYERCYHLSLSFVDPTSGDRLDQDKRLASAWCSLFFGQDKRLLWCEPPYSEKGRQYHVWHYRLFCDPGWQAIQPRREVYSRQFTQKGWKSFADLHGYRAKEAELTWGHIAGEKTG